MIDPVNKSDPSRKIAAIILAAGGSERLGSPKQFLSWKGQPLIRQVATLAVSSHLDPILVITGELHDRIRETLIDLPITLVRNDGWQEGQSSSIRVGINSLPREVKACFFLLVDQPQIEVELITALIDRYRTGKPDILAPQVEGNRGNPVLFDRRTFPALQRLQGNQGGRTIFSEFKLEYMSWPDRRILMDIDTPEDYEKLKSMNEN